MGQNFEVTKEGIKFSYLRFLSDSSAGYILLLLFGVAYLLKLPMPFIGESWLKAIPQQPSTELQVFLFFISFLIATPLGLLLNGAGWFLFGTPIICLLNVWTVKRKVISFIINFFTAGTRWSYFSDKTAQFLDLGPPSALSAKKFYMEANYYEAILSIYFPSYYDQLEPARGLRRFTRSLGLLLLMTSLYCFITLRQARLGVFTLILFAFFLLFNSLLEYYQWLKVFFMVYSLSSDLHSGNPSREEIVKNLKEISVKLRTI